MKTLFVENEGESQKIYNTILVRPENLNVFSNGMPGRILRELGRQPQCAMDISRKLKEHEQNVYYHLKRLRNAGLIRLANQENRAGMTAKIYELVSPVVAAKLYEEGYTQKEVKRHKLDPLMEKFLEPFVINNRLHAKVILGDPYPHGEFDVISTESVHAFDLALLLGSFLNEVKFPSYHLDTETDPKDIKENMILIGNSKTNTIIKRINSSMPVYFDAANGWSIMSRKTGNSFNAPRTGMLVKFPNPLNPNKKVLVIGGIGIRGVKAGIIAITKHLEEIVGNDFGDVAKVFEGIDKDGDGVVDSIKILE